MSTHLYKLLPNNDKYSSQESLENGSVVDAAKQSDPFYVRVELMAPRPNKPGLDLHHDVIDLLPLRFLFDFQTLSLMKM